MTRICKNSTNIISTWGAYQVIWRNATKSQACAFRQVSTRDIHLRWTLHSAQMSEECSAPHSLVSGLVSSKYNCRLLNSGCHAAPMIIYNVFNIHLLLVYTVQYVVFPPIIFFTIPVCSDQLACETVETFHGHITVGDLCPRGLRQNHAFCMRCTF